MRKILLTILLLILFVSGVFASYTLGGSIGAFSEFNVEKDGYYVELEEMPVKFDALFFFFGDYLALNTALGLDLYGASAIFPIGLGTDLILYFNIQTAPWLDILIGGGLNYR